MAETRRAVNVGDTVTVILPYSEACMHLRVAGQRRRIVVTEHGAQILELDGRPYSFPITHGEAGLRVTTYQPLTLEMVVPPPIEQISTTSEHDVELWEVTTEDDLIIHVRTNGNGGFGPVNVWDGHRWHAVKYRRTIGGRLAGRDAYRDGKPAALNPDDIAGLPDDIATQVTHEYRAGWLTASLDAVRIESGS